MTPLQGAPCGIVIYTDASFSPYCGHSVSGVLIQFRGRNVLWKAKRQSIVCLSTAESELVAACEGTVVGQSTESLILELVDLLEPKQLLVDNIAAVVLAEGGGSGRTRHLRVRASFITDLIERRELNVDHCPGDLQLADIFTKVLPGPRHRTLSAMLGLGPIDLNPVVAALRVKVEDRLGTTSSGDVGHPRAWLWIIIIMLQVWSCAGAEESDVDLTPLGHDLSLMMLLLTFSVLFIWEAGKACIQSCRHRQEEVQVAAFRAEEDEQQGRRARRQEAVRRAIEAETEGLRRRRDESSDEHRPAEVSIRPYVHVQVDTARPPPPPPDYDPRPAHHSDTSFGLRDYPSSSITPPESSAPENPLPPPPVQISGSGRESPSKCEVATQTDERRGLSYEDLQGIQVLTSTSRTPGVVHIFPGCHALRGVNTHQRQFCRYCLQGVGRSGI